MAAPAVQQRTLAAAGRSLARQARPAVVGPAQQVRGVKTIDFAGSKEDVYGMSCGELGLLLPSLWLTIELQSVPTGPRRSFL